MRKVIIALILFLITSISYSDSNKNKNEIEKKNVEKKSSQTSSSSKDSSKKVDWDTSFFFSYSIFKGNTNGEKYFGNASLSCKAENFNFSLYYEKNYGENNDVVNIDKSKFTANLNKKLKNAVSINSSALFEKDAIVHLQRRINFGLGFGYIKSILKGHEFSLVGNLLYEVSIYENSIDETKKNVRLALTFDNKLKFYEYSEMETKIFYTPNLLDFLDDYRIEVSSSLRILMKKPLWFRFSLKNNYNNSPPSTTIKKNDFSMLTGLEIII